MNSYSENTFPRSIWQAAPAKSYIKRSKIHYHVYHLMSKTATTGCRNMPKQTNFDKALEEKYRHQTNLAVKDSYNFDFLELGEEYDERNMELGLIKNVRSFLLEMGGDFSFIRNQYKLDVDGDEFFIDLLLYHRRLRCMVAIEMKTTNFVPEYTGKMQFYLSVLDDKIKQEEENPSIGIIICKTKRRTVVEYALKNAGSPMGVANYSLSKILPKSLKGMLPSSKEIIERLIHLAEQV